MKFQETESVELKRELNESVTKEIVAFLSTHDGVIYIGVEDDGTVCGVKNLDDVQKRIADIITMQIMPNPQSLIELGTKYIDGKNVVVINVKKGDALYYIKKYGRSAAGCFIRIGTTCRSMTEEEIERRFIKQMSASKNSMRQMLSPTQNLTFNQMQAILNFKNVHFNIDTFEDNYNLKNDEGKYNYIAFLISDQNDTSIKVIRFDGVTKAKILSRKEFEKGCIFRQMEEALEYSLNILDIVQTDVVGTKRIDVPYFDAEAFREAWYNAVCHNLWTEKTPPAIYGFDDRVEIISYGLLKDGMTKEEFFKGISKPVNEEFAKIFMRLHYMEQVGKGVPTVVLKYSTDVYKFGSSFIQCILPYNILDKSKQSKLNKNKTSQSESILRSKVKNEVENDVENDVENIRDEKTSLEDLLVKLILKNNKISKTKMASATGKSISTVERELSKSKKIVRVGADRGGYWKVQIDN